MIPLDENKKVFTWFGICPLDGRSPQRTKSYRYIVIFLFYFGMTCMFLSSVTYFAKHVSNDLENALYALFEIVGIFNSLFSVTVGIFLNKKIAEIFKNYEQFYAESEYLNHEFNEIHQYDRFNCTFRPKQKNLQVFGKCQ